MKTIKIDGRVVKINYDGSVIYVDGRLAKPTLFQKSKPKSGGYWHVKIGRKSHLVHRLVAMAYVPNPLNKRLVTHKNTKTTNNHYTNLEWGDQKDIVARMVENNRPVPDRIKPKPKPTAPPTEVLNLWRKGARPHEIAIKLNSKLAEVVRIIDESRARLHYITK